MLHQLFSSKDDLNKSFWENIHFGRVVVWYSVNQIIIHFFKASIPPSTLFLFILFFKIFSFFSNYLFPFLNKNNT